MILYACVTKFTARLYVDQNTFIYLHLIVFMAARSHIITTCDHLRIKWSISMNFSQSINISLTQIQSDKYHILHQTGRVFFFVFFCFAQMPKMQLKTIALKEKSASIDHIAHTTHLNGNRIDEYIRSSKNQLQFKHFRKLNHSAFVCICYAVVGLWQTGAISIDFAAAHLISLRLIWCIIDLANFR